jgi:hypothetical protein
MPFQVLKAECRRSPSSMMRHQPLFATQIISSNEPTKMPNGGFEQVNDTLLFAVVEVDLQCGVDSLLELLVQLHYPQSV